jgi:hypothetical protein
MMASLRNFPWFSLTFLLITYASFGYFMFSSPVPWVAWVIAIGWVFGLAFFFIAPLRSVRTVTYRWLKTDAIAFFALVILAALVPTVILWGRAFLYILILLAAETLARLDIQVARFSAIQSFWILSTTSLAGLGLGWFVHQLTIAPR